MKIRCLIVLALFTASLGGSPAQAQYLKQVIDVSIYSVISKKNSVSKAVGLSDYKNDSVRYWYKDRKGRDWTSLGSSNNPTKHTVVTRRNFGKKRIVAIAHSYNGGRSRGRTYFWYSDGMVSSGNIRDTTKYRKYYRSNIARNKHLIGAAIARNDHVYYWYSDGTVSAGRTDNPVKHRIYYKSNLRKKLIGVAIAKTNDHVYYWYCDGTVSSGTTTNPTKYRKYYESHLIRSRKMNTCR